jgi:hypothetical protein
MTPTKAGCRGEKTRRSALLAHMWFNSSSVSVKLQSGIFYFIFDKLEERLPRGRKCPKQLTRGELLSIYLLLLLLLLSHNLSPCETLAQRHPPSLKRTQLCSPFRVALQHKSKRANACNQQPSLRPAALISAPLPQLVLSQSACLQTFPPPNPSWIIITITNPHHKSPYPLSETESPRPWLTHVAPSPCSAASLS